jgi:hypothetical protein
MGLQLITNQEQQRSQAKCNVSLYDFLPDTKLSELTQEQKKNEFKNIIHLLEMNYNRKFENDKIITFIQLMSKDGYGLQRIKDCFENLIRTNPYPNFNYAQLTNYSKNLYTQFDVLKSGRGYGDFIRCETPTKEIFYWDKKNGELPKVLKFKPLLKPEYVIFFDKQANNTTHWDINALGECPYPCVTEKEFSELTNTELNKRLQCSFYFESNDELTKQFLKNYVKII